MAIDYLAFDDANQARLRHAVGTARKVLPADDIEDAITKHETAPLLCTILSESESDGPLVASRTTIDQREELRLIVVVVAESFRDKADGTAGAYRLIEEVKLAMRSREWKNPHADGPFVFERWRFMTRRGPRVAYQIEFRATAVDDYARAA
ncbi:MAG: hypothetical protein ACTHQM_26345 [Thermoanaerobaculia bacterium]